MSILSKVFGNYNEKELKKLWPIVKEVNAFEDAIHPLTDEQLRAKTDDFRERLADGETLDDILPEAFAVVREMSQRRLGMRPFDVQILGGVVLHQGKISEMKTGEGKTLVATLPIYLNGLAGQGVHLITVNDYLAKRDAQWMGALYDALGLTIGILQHDSGYLYDRTANLDNESLRHMTPVDRREVYGADITYGTNNEFGFDFLRDNMATDFARAVQRQEIPQSYAIVDEVDSILIDEARTPLIISGPAEETEEIYRTFGRIVPRMSPEQDLIVDLKHKSVGLTEEGVDKVEKALGIKNLYDSANFRLTRFLDAALKAQFLYQREHQYVVKDGEVVIVDEFTGRLMTGRRWSDGLHQAVEAKEGVKIQRESVTYATITLQNYFRMYKKLAGMTGTAWTERDEFHQIYGLDVLVIPTHQPMVRADMQDIIFKGVSGKFNAVVEEIEDAHGDGRPMLVGTIAIETSELLSDLLKRKSTCHLEDCAEYYKVCPLKEPAVLNAKQHEREAHIIEMAGVPGAVTIATNMAGRGTDIVLGGNPERMAEVIARKQGVDLLTAPEDVTAPIREQARQKWQDEHNRVIATGGLHIIGTERHESRRIDNQLRGRAGRQGDPGSSRFFVSFGDDLMKRFSPEWVPNLLGKMGMDEDTPLESKMVSKAIEQAQTKVEGHNFDIRKHVVQYDDVMNRHRDLIYTERRKILEGVDLSDNIAEMIEREIKRVFDTFLADTDHDMWEVESLIGELKTIMPLPTKFTTRRIRELAAEEGLNEVLESAREAYGKKEEELGEERMRTLERLLFLRVIDRLWVYHLTALDELRQGIGLRGYGQRDPLVEFKLEAHDMYDQLTEHISQDTVRQIYHVTLTAPVVRPQPPKQVSESGPDEDAASGATTTQVAAASGGGGGVTATATAAPANRKVGRNQPCPCGSGKKYKKCHGGTSAV
ncbi:MAG: preprotein translocase subunit SecA [Chloroflexi bacterium]|nr:preprotein translocase subunit SecA [Chloroflexota bacterium]